MANSCMMYIVSKCIIWNWKSVVHTRLVSLIYCDQKSTVQMSPTMQITNYVTAIIFVFNPTLQSHCKVWLLSWHVVCHLSVLARVYCDKTTDAICYFHWKVVKCLNFHDEIRRRSPRLGAQNRVGCFQLPPRRYILESYKTELRSQLIANTKSYMSFRFVQKSMTLNDLERSKHVQSPVTKSNLLRAQRSANVIFTNLCLLAQLWSLRMCMCDIAEISASIKSVKFVQDRLPNWTSSTHCEYDYKHVGSYERICYHHIETNGIVYFCLLSTEKYEAL